MDNTPQPSVVRLQDVQLSCIRCRGIDSWQKLHVVLWLYEHRDLRLTCEELAERLFLGDPGTAKAMLGELREAGFVVAVEGRCALNDTPDVLRCLDQLRRLFTDPLARQALIERIRQAGAGSTAG